MVRLNRKIKWIGIIVAIILLSGIIILKILFQIGLNNGVKVVDLPVDSHISSLNINSDYADAYMIQVNDSLNVSDLSSFLMNLGKEVFRSDDEIVVEGTAPGLIFYASLHIDEGHNLSLNTVVIYKELIGRIYFTPVKIFHKHALPYLMHKEFKEYKGL